MTVAAAITADFVHEPYLHQLREFEASAELPARALLWQMRTGKTKLVVDTACHLRRIGAVDCVLVFAPNGVHENWVRRELPKHHWHSVGYEALSWRTHVAGTAAENQRAKEQISGAAYERWRHDHETWWACVKRLLKSDELVWLSFNSESMTRDDVRKLVARVLKRRRVMVVFDESDDYRKPGSKRAKMAIALSNRCAYRRILTGTVITNSPLAAWSQYQLLERGALGFEKYSDFKRHHAVYDLERTRAGRQYPKLREYVHLEELRDRMARLSSVVLREDCEDLPDLVMRSRRVQPTDEQLRVYRELHRQYVVELEDGRIVSIGEQAARLNKLQQVMSGFLKDEYGEVHWLSGGNPRLEAVSDEVYLSPGKVIVWCHFRPDIAAVAARLRADGHETVEYHGGIGDEAKQRNLDAFQNDPEVKALVGQPGSGGRGLDMSAADEIYNYSHTFDAIYREQSLERATAVHGDNVGVTDLVMPGPDGYILESVSKKIDVADYVAGHGLKEALRRCKI